MALPTIWQLILPSLSITTILGLLLMAIGIFKGGILRVIGLGLAAITGGRITASSLRWALIGGGAVMVWLPSIIKDLFSSIEGIALFVGVIVGVILLMMVISSLTGNKDEETF